MGCVYHINIKIFEYQYQKWKITLLYKCVMLMYYYV